MVCQFLSTACKNVAISHIPFYFGIAYHSLFERSMPMRFGCYPPGCPPCCCPPPGPTGATGPAGPAGATGATGPTGASDIPTSFAQFNVIPRAYEHEEFLSFSVYQIRGDDISLSPDNDTLILLQPAFLYTFSYDIQCVSAPANVFMGIIPYIATSAELLYANFSQSSIENAPLSCNGSFSFYFPFASNISLQFRCSEPLTVTGSFTIHPVVK